MKYHSSIGIPAQIKYNVQCLVEQLRQVDFKYSYHAINSMQDESDFNDIKQAICDYMPLFKDVFEIYSEGNTIEKIGFRIPFNNRDIVFIVSNRGYIITLWTNDVRDNHSTLNKQLYATV
jgi:hypothetical protein